MHNRSAQIRYESGIWDCSWTSGLPVSRLRLAFDDLTSDGLWPLCVHCVCTFQSTFQSSGDDTVRVTLHLRNSGFLPTYGAQRGIETNAVRDHGIATLTVGDGLTLLHGDRMTDVPHLSGRASAFDSESPVASYGASPANTHETTLEWIVRGRGMLEVQVDLQRGGLHKCLLQVPTAVEERAATSKL